MVDFIHNDAEYKAVWAELSSPHMVAGTQRLSLGVDPLTAFKVSEPGTIEIELEDDVWATLTVPAGQLGFSVCDENTTTVTFDFEPGDERLVQLTLELDPDE